MSTAFLLASMVLLPAADQLGDKRFAIREKAHKLLASAGPVGWLTLARAETMSEEGRRRAMVISPQWHAIRSDARADEIVRQWCLKLSDATTIRYQPLPWLTFSSNGYGTNESHLAAEAHADMILRGMTVDWLDHSNYRWATHLWIRSVVRQGWTAPRIFIELDRMRELEFWYRGRNK